jgi:hypothetical protein
MTSPRGTTEVGRRHIPGRTWLGAAVAPLLLTAGLLAACGPAHGTVRTRDGGRNLFFTAAAGKANDVTVTRDGEDLLVNDAGDTITPGDGCTAEDANTVRCGGITFMLLDLKDGNDEASNNTDVPAFPGEGEGGIIGGPGNDVLDGGTAEDILVGDQGTDTLNGNDGDDHLVEGLTSASTDVLDADTFNGGTGRDEVSYSAATLGVNVDLDGNADDGRPGEIDNVRIDVEDITGGDAADDLVGNAGDNTLRGRRSMDKVGPTCSSATRGTTCSSAGQAMTSCSRVSGQREPIPLTPTPSTVGAAWTPPATATPPSRCRSTSTTWPTTGAPGSSTTCGPPSSTWRVAKAVMP